MTTYTSANFGKDTESSVKVVARNETLIANLQQRVESNRAAGRAAKKKESAATPATSDELLAHYVNALRDIPPFTPQEEYEAAKNLEDLEVETWMHVMPLPQVRQWLNEQRSQLDASILQTLLATQPQPSEIAAAIRQFDTDKQVIESLLIALEEIEAAQNQNTPLSQALKLARQTRAKAVEARNNFISANLRLVISVARAFKRRGVSFVDSIQEGNLGLLRAVDRFDPNRGFRFSTYAHWWIRHCIRRALVNTGPQVRLPVHVAEAKRRIEKARNELRGSLGREPTAQELANAVETSIEKLEQHFQECDFHIMSLDDTLGGDDGRSFVELLHDELQPAIDDEVLSKQFSGRVEALLSELKPIEKDIIERRFGLQSHHAQTLEQVSSAHKLSRERVRQIQQQGLDKLRRMCRYSRFTA